MLTLRLSRCLRVASPSFKYCGAIRRITVDVYRRKKQDTVYEGPNVALLPSNPEKKEEMNSHRDAYESVSSEQRETIITMKNLLAKGDYSGVLETFREESEHSGVSYGIVLSACARGTLFPQAMDIWHEMPDKYKTNVTYSTMLDVCRRTKKASVAESLMAEMTQNGISPNIIMYRTLIGVYSMVGDTEKAMDIFKTVKETCLHSASQVSKQMTYLMIMSAFSRKGDYKSVKDLFDEMTSTGVPPDHTHFNSLLTASIQGGHMDIAEAIIDIMPKWGLNPRVEDFSALVSACRLDLPRCKAAYAKMKEAGVAPSSRTYKAYISAHLSAGDHHTAQELLAEAKRSLRCGGRELENLEYQMRQPSE